MPKPKIFIHFILFFCFCLCVGKASAEEAPNYWPPQIGMKMTDLLLQDQNGNPLRTTDLKGSVILVEYVGMSCPACQAFSGASRMGAYGGVVPQPGVKSIEEFVALYGKGIQLTDERLIFVQILLYDLNLQAPTQADARQWAAHFGFDRAQNQIVLAGTKELLGDAAYNLIPGFQLVDKNFIVRSDSTGHHPKENLFTTLIPMISQLLGE